LTHWQDTVDNIAILYVYSLLHVWNG